MVGLIVIGLYFWSTNRVPEQPDTPQTEKSMETASPSWETQVDTQSSITVSVTPTELGKDAEMWRFKIVFDTHSGDLNDDLLSVVALIDDKGNVYQPTDWEGPGPGGHHREGVLSFKSIRPATTFVELKIANAGDVLERSFKWNI